MTTTKTDKQHGEAAKEGHQQRQALIGRRVLEAMGRPAALQGVRVRPLWEDHYRVNVLVGADAATARIAHSYFLTAGEDGTILAATPTITRQYEATAGASA